MKKIQLKIIGMSYSQSQSNAYALILGEVHGTRRLPIIIGGFEAQAIAIVLEKLNPSRPLTHDLFKNFALQFNIHLKEVVINKFFEGVFYAKLVCEYNGEEVEIDSRTSDAVALALRFKCPIYTYENIMKVSGVSKEEMPIEQDTKKEEQPETKSDLNDYTVSELNDLLDQAVEKEDYERASLIRDEINRRKDKKK